MYNPFIIDLPASSFVSNSFLLALACDEFLLYQMKIIHNFHSSYHSEEILAVKSFGE